MLVAAVRPARRTPRRGAAAVEFAMVAIVLMMLLFGIIEYARFLFVDHMMANACREATRFAVVSSASTTLNPVTTTQIQNYADNYLAGQGPLALVGYTPTTSVSVFRLDPTTGTKLSDWSNASAGQAMGVSISGTYKPITPLLLFLPSSMTMTNSCVMMCEAN